MKDESGLDLLQSVEQVKGDIALVESASRIKTRCLLLRSRKGAVWAYGEGSAGDAASTLYSKVQFSEFTPEQYSQDANSTEVAPESEFSFLASKETFPKSIAVTIKGETVPIAVAPHYAGYQVTGNVPSNTRGSFIRIEIEAKGPHGCERGDDGWLLKVADKEAIESAKAK